MRAEPPKVLACRFQGLRRDLETLETLINKTASSWGSSEVNVVLLRSSEPMQCTLGFGARFLIRSCSESGQSPARARFRGSGVCFFLCPAATMWRVGQICHAVKVRPRSSHTTFFCVERHGGGGAVPAAGLFLNEDCAETCKGINVGVSMALTPSPILL